MSAQYEFERNWISYQQRTAALTGRNAETKNIGERQQWADG